MPAEPGRNEASDETFPGKVKHMSPKSFQLAIVGLWLALPLTALRYWMAWDRLPSRIATHFDAAGQPNGYMTPQASLIFVLGLMTFLLVVATAILLAIQRKFSRDPFSLAMVGFFYVLLGFIFYGNESILHYNLEARPVELTPFVLVVLAVFALMAVYLGTRRGEALPQQAWLAEERHASRLWALVFVIPLAIELAAMAAVPLRAVRIGMGLMCLLFAVLAAQAWTGFEYRFGPAGVEVRTLGFRLRSIPLDQIRGYAVEAWNPLRGYGIRGIGDRRAYVWGNRGVMIKTSSGEVFLGHSDPDCLVRDLDRVTGMTKQGSGMARELA